MSAGAEKRQRSVCDPADEGCRFAGPACVGSGRWLRSDSPTRRSCWKRTGTRRVGRRWCCQTMRSTPCGDIGRCLRVFGAVSKNAGVGSAGSMQAGGGHPSKEVAGRLRTAALQLGNFLDRDECQAKNLGPEREDRPPPSRLSTDKTFFCVSVAPRSYVGLCGWATRRRPR